MAVIRVTLFGAPRIAQDGRSVTVERRKTLALLAYLAVTGRAHSREALITLLWPDLDAARGRAQLRNALPDLQRAIGKGRLDTESDQLALRAGPGLSVDVSRFHDLLAQVAAHSHPPHRLCDSCLSHLVDATGLYTDDFLAGFTLGDAAEFDAWQTFQTESLRLELAEVLEKLAQGLAGRGQWEAAIGHARRWLALDPLHEPAQRLLMQLHAWAGDRAAAVRQYQECVKVLQEELGLEPEPETTALFEAIRTAHAPVLPLSLSPIPTRNLPPDPTPFIGREPELVQIAERLADTGCRLLTILGPGGMGKTRLAIQAARSAADTFAQGVCFVDLAPIASAEQLAETILRALQVPSQGATEPDQHVLNCLADKQMLLVLDNYEHLLTGPEPDRRDGYGLVTKMLGAAPRVKLLVTSRARLNVRAEWLAPLDGLETPEDLEHEGAKEPYSGAGEDRKARRTRSDAQESSRFANFEGLRDFAIQPTALEHYSATALFLACVRRVQPDFRPTAGDARHIAHICRLLGGTPLAIELAAAWIRMLPLAQIERELEHGFAFLVTTLRDVEPRHRSMIAAFDHSWGLLSTAERSILRQLSVFRGGFTREAAHEVTGATVADLAGLADASWLRLGEHGRYQIHELVRQYCAEKLETEHERETGETPDQVRDRHASHYSSLLRTRLKHFYQQPQAMREITRDLDNLLTAWDWLLLRRDLDEVYLFIMEIFWLCAQLAVYHTLLSLLDRGIRVLKALALAEPADSVVQRKRDLVLSLLLTHKAEVIQRTGPLTRARIYQEEAGDLLRNAESQDERWFEVRWRLGRIQALQRYREGHFLEASDLFRSLLSELEAGCLKMWPYSDEAACVRRAEINSSLGSQAWALGRYQEACYYTERSKALAEQVASEWGTALSSATRTLALFYTGKYEQAEIEALHGVRVMRAFGDRLQTMFCMSALGRLYVAWGKYDRARVCGRRLLALAHPSGLPVQSAHALCILGAVELAQGNVSRAKERYEAARAQYQRPGSAESVGFAACLVGAGRVALAEGDLTAVREHLRQALISTTCTRGDAADAVMILAQAFLTEGHLERATELLAFVTACPATQHSTREQASKQLDDLETRVPPGIFAAVTTRGRARQVDEVVAELVGG